MERKLMKRAFTLPELLVVIAIIAILVAILFPVLNSAEKNAHRSTCVNNLKQINLAVRLYADEHGDLLTLISNSHCGTAWIRCRRNIAKC
jgi:prepilin-type N-terminal cleavage/methylation domain-containing protein